MIDWFVYRQCEQSLTDSFHDLKYHGLDEDLLSIIKSAKADLVLLNEKVEQYAETLDDQAKKSFMSSWGVKTVVAADEEGLDGSEDSDSNYSCSAGNEKLEETGKRLVYYRDVIMQNVLFQRLLQVNRSAFREEKNILYHIQSSSEPLSETRIVRLLFEDLMTDKVLAVFKAKCKSDKLLNSDTVEPKRFVARMFAIALVLWYVWVAMINVFFFGLDRDSSSQELWSITVLTWFLLDILVLQCVHTISTEVLIPSLIVSKVKNIQALIVRCICELDSLKLKGKKFRWSLMLFSSAKVVSKFYSTRFSELIMAICLSVPLRSRKNLTFSTRALAFLNVHNCESDYILTSNNDKNWDSHCALSDYCFFFSSFPLLSELLSTLVICSGILFAIKISRARSILLVFILVIFVVSYTCTCWLFLTHDCASKHRRKSTRRDRDEYSRQILGRRPYTPKEKKPIVRRNAAVLKSEQLLEFAQKLNCDIKKDMKTENHDVNDGLGLITSMNKSIEMIKSTDSVSITDEAVLIKSGRKKKKSKRKKRKEVEHEFSIKSSVESDLGCNSSGNSAAKSVQHLPEVVISKPLDEHIVKNEFHEGDKTTYVTERVEYQNYSTTDNNQNPKTIINTDFSLVDDDEVDELRLELKDKDNEIEKLKQLLMMATGAKDYLDVKTSVVELDTSRGLLRARNEEAPQPKEQLTSFGDVGKVDTENSLFDSKRQSITAMKENKSGIKLNDALAFVEHSTKLEDDSDSLNSNAVGEPLNSVDDNNQVETIEQFGSNRDINFNGGLIVPNTVDDNNSQKRDEADNSDTYGPQKKKEMANSNTDVCNGLQQPDKNDINGLDTGETKFPKELNEILSGISEEEKVKIVLKLTDQTLHPNVAD
jgi:hypothetical protein